MLSPLPADYLPLSGTWRAILTNRFEEPAKFEDRVREDEHGFSDKAKSLMAKTVDDSGWREVAVPGAWERYGGEWANADGEAVFRKTIDVPDAWSGRMLLLRLGRIHAFDDVYWNGQKIGRTNVHKSPEGTRTLTTRFVDGQLSTAINQEEERWWMWPSTYTVPAEMVRPGRNVLAVRIFND